MSDVHHAARALVCVPPEARHSLCAQLLWQAHTADKYVKRLRRLHPRWGDGSLRAACLAHASGRKIPMHSAALWPCMAIVLDCLAARTWAGPNRYWRERVCMPRNCAK